MLPRCPNANHSKSTFQGTEVDNRDSIAMSADASFCESATNVARRMENQPMMDDDLINSLDEEKEDISLKLDSKRRKEMTAKYLYIRDFIKTNLFRNKMILEMDKHCTL